MQELEKSFGICSFSKGFNFEGNYENKTLTKNIAFAVQTSKTKYPKFSAVVEKTILYNI